MKIVMDHVDGREIIDGVEGVTVTAFGVFTTKDKVAEWTMTNIGQLALADTTGRLLGSLSVEP